MREGAPSCGADDIVWPCADFCAHAVFAKGHGRHGRREWRHVGAPASSLHKKISNKHHFGGVA